MTYIFDFVIFFILFYSGFWMYLIIRSFFSDKKDKVRTRIVRVVGLFFLLIIFATIFYGSFIEPNRIVVTDYKVNLNKTKSVEKIKIAFISDLHVGWYKDFVFLERVVDKIRKQDPDLVLLGGDYIFDRESDSKYLFPLESLAEKYPVYAVLGNHEFNQAKYGDPSYEDHSQSVRTLFAEWGIEFLVNENEIIAINGQEIAIIGIDDLFHFGNDLETAKKGVSSEIPQILLSHNPDIIEDQFFNSIDLTLSGHTHAGQIRLPYWGPVSPLPVNLDRTYDKGLFDLVENGQLIISSGLGESGTRARLFNPPELVIIELDL